MTTLGVERGNDVDLQRVGDSPPAVRAEKPKWTQFRFLGGVLLIIASVLIGAKIVQGADKSSIALVATHPLSAGMTVTDADVTPVKVRLFGDQDGRYVSGSIPPGYVALRDIAAQELLPRSAIGVPAQLAPAGTLPVRWVTVPVRAGHYPPGIHRGGTVDIYTSVAAANTAPTTTLLLPNVLVDAGVGASPGGLGGGTGGPSVVLVIPADKVTDVLTAVQSNALDLVDVHVEKVG